jgi:hypothetical protein
LCIVDRFKSTRHMLIAQIRTCAIKFVHLNGMLIKYVWDSSPLINYKMHHSAINGFWECGQKLRMEFSYPTERNCLSSQLVSYLSPS